MTMPMQRVSPRLITALICLYFFGLCFAYASTTPHFEAPDEGSHYMYIHNLLETGELPVMEDREAMFASRSVQRHHPPLYYLVGAALVSFTNRDNLDEFNYQNSLAAYGVVSPNNLNLMLHLLHTSGDTGLAISILRLYSMALATGTVFLIYRTAYLVTQRHVIGWAAMLLVASMPTFLFISASINNDNLVTFLYAAGVCWTIWTWQKRSITRRDSLILGAILAGVALSKINGLSLIGLVYGWLIIGIWRKRFAWRDVATTIAVSGVMVALLAGWWYLRNLQLYGEPLALRATHLIWGRAAPENLYEFLKEMKGVWDSLWMVLGHFTIRAPEWVYGYVTLFSLIGAAGLALIFGQEAKARWTIVLLLSVIGLVVTSLIVTTMSINVSQGRILFPALVAFAPLLMWGWHKLVGRWLFALPLVPLLILTWSVPLAILPASYPPPVVVTQIPAEAKPINATAETLTLLAYQTYQDTLTPDDVVRLSVYIQGTHAGNPLLYVKAIDPLTLVPIGGVDEYPGMTFTSDFDPNVIYRIDLRFALDRAQLTGTEPRQLDFIVGWYLPGEDIVNEVDNTPIQWINSDGAATDWLRLPGITLMDPAYTLPVPQIPVDVRYGDTIQLVGYALSSDEIKAGDTVEITLFWRSTGAAAQAWTTAVGILDDNNAPIAQADGMVAGYPTTAWRAGGDTLDRRTLTIPADAASGEYRLFIGWYNPQDASQRLPAQGDGVENNLYISMPILTVTDD